MKRSFAVLLGLMMVLSILTACSADESPDLTGGRDNTVTTVADNASETEVDNGTTVLGTSGNSTEDTSEASFAATAENSDTAKKLMDNRDVAVTALDCVQDSSGFTMNVELENKSDRDIEFRVAASALNGKDVHLNFEEEVTAGSSVTAPMSWTSDELEDRSVKTVEEVKIMMTITAHEGEEEEVIAEEIFVINP